MRRIGGLLGRSPFGPLYEQMTKVICAVEELSRLMEALSTGDEAAVTKSADRIRQIEREADDIKCEIRDRLSNSLFASVDRAETLLLVSGIDSIADDALGVAKLVAVRRTHAGGKLGEDLVALAGRALEAAQGLLEILRLLRELMDGSAARAEASKVLDKIGALGELDAALEDAEIDILRGLFQHEAELGAVDVMILMNVIRQVADTARRSENVADGIRRIVLNR
ncbi:MAG: DUF47 family protein [Planctomycetota bacterium]|jgi:predicted phosphate transport protein (TIGR00153 family)